MRLISHNSLLVRWFSSGFSILVELEFGDAGICGGRKTGEPGEKLSKPLENQQQTQPTYDTGLKSNPGHIVGRRALSPLRHPCSPTEIDSLLTANVSRVTFFQDISDTWVMKALSFIPALFLSCFLQVKATRLVKTSLLIPTGL